MLVAGSGLGVYYSRRLYRRVDFLRQADRLLETVVGRLTYTALPLGALWRRLAEEEIFTDCSLLTDTVAALETKPFAAAFARAVEQAASAGLVDTQGKSLLLEFANLCGRVGPTQQAAQIRACQSGLRLLQQQAQEQAAARGQVYQMLGVAGGVGLSLLLL